jgi:thymidylate synthase
MTALATRLRFEALYHGDRLHLVNPEGDVGLLTLWSPVAAVRRKLQESDPRLLDPAASRIAVIANLYGDGMQAMLCNLLFNPQVRHLVAVGNDLGLGVPAQIEAFLRDGLEPATLLGRPYLRIAGTDRLFEAAPGFDAERLRATLTFAWLGRLRQPGLGARLAEHVERLPHHEPAGERVRVELPPPPARERLPSDAGAHQVRRPTPLAAWRELVVRCLRFGEAVELAKGRRLELRNAQAVIAAPVEEPAEALARFGFDRAGFRAYQRRILEAALPEDVTYTYGHRLRAHFGRDTLADAIRTLREDPASRQAYVTLWDPATDAAAASTPCLTTLFFRVAGGRLTLTATYRAHNLMRAWLENVYGLMAIQRHVAEATGLPPGPITVISHSLSITPEGPRYELARALAEDWDGDDEVDPANGRTTLREDPHGYFVVSSDPARGLVVAEHRHEGVLVKRYAAPSGKAIEHAVAADMAVSLVSHALWLGRELTRHERMLRDG